MSPAISHGFGRHVNTIPEEDFVLFADYLFAVFVTATSASSFARIFIACLLLQFITHRTWRVIIWGAVLMQVSMFLLYDIAQFIQCKSAISSKERWVNAECLSPKLEQAFTYSSVGTLKQTSCFKKKGREGLKYLPKQPPPPLSSHV